MDQAREYHKDIKPELYVSLDGFEGPLDLLLTLAKKQKVDLKKLQLGILADQFLDYLREQRYKFKLEFAGDYLCLLYTSPSPRDPTKSRMPSSA